MNSVVCPQLFPSQFMKSVFVPNCFDPNCFDPNCFHPIVSNFFLHGNDGSGSAPSNASADHQSRQPLCAGGVGKVNIVSLTNLISRYSWSKKLHEFRGLSPMPLS